MRRANQFFPLANVVLLGVVFFSDAAAKSDVACLASIKDSIQDPFEYLNTWDFSNQTEGFFCQLHRSRVLEPYGMEHRVFSLNLANMGLKGNFPPGLAYCASIMVLTISNNGFSGTIPSDISKILPYAISLDLSSNHFSGVIPADLANCVFISDLEMDHNRLTGCIPQEFSRFGRIRRFNVADNFLTGPIPNISGTSAEDFANNPGLCGGPLPPCKSAF